MQTDWCEHERNSSDSFTFDPFKPSFHDDPYPGYHKLLADFPVFHDRHHDLWYVARYDDVANVFRDRETYSNVTRMSSGFLPMLATMDAPRHDELRAMVAGDFTPARVEKFRHLVRETVRSLLSGLAAAGGCDFIADFAREVPTRVTCALLGIPQEMRAEFEGLVDEIFPTFDASDGLQADIGVRIYSVCERLIEFRRRHPGDDVTSRLLAAQAGIEVTHEELVAYVLQLLVAGFETTRSLLGNTMWLLAEYPDQRTLLRRSPELIPAAIDESLRVESPTPMIFRAAKQTVRLHSETIEAGAVVVPIMASANRDPAAFSEPDVFDVNRRSQRPHLAFGSGIHFCLGSHLARLEGVICLEEILAKLPDWSVADDGCRRHRTPIARGFLSLPLVLH